MINFINFSSANKLDISGHKDIDFVDIFVNTDVSLFLDAERIEFSSGECAEKSLAAIQDFFRELYTAVEYGDMIRVRHLADDSSRLFQQGAKAFRFSSLGRQFRRRQMF